MAAGVALENAARLFFTYKGAMFWKMQAGMGDVVFAPLYQVLRRRGVRFRFFHRVTGLRLAADRRSIGAIDMARQVELVDPGRRVRAAGGRAGPAVLAGRAALGAGGGMPIASAAANLESFWAPSPDAAALTLTAGQDFDRVIFGISLGAVPHLCRELIDASDRWRAMVEHVGTVPTQAFQVWLSATTHELGWPWPLSNMSSFVEPFDTYADMSHLLDREAVAGGRGGGERRVFLQCAAGAASAGRRARSGLSRRRRGDGEGQRHRVPSPLGAPPLARVAWTRPPASFAGSLLAGRRRRPRRGALRLAVLARQRRPVRSLRALVPGTGRHRIKPGETGFDNLVIAGDWTDCGLNAGCVEAAVMSGRLAAHAVTGTPRLEDIVGYPHP